MQVLLVSSCKKRKEEAAGPIEFLAVRFTRRTISYPSVAFGAGQQRRCSFHAVHIFPRDAAVLCCARSVSKSMDPILRFVRLERICLSFVPHTVERGNAILSSFTCFPR